MNRRSAVVAARDLQPNWSGPHLHRLVATSRGWLERRAGAAEYGFAPATPLFPGAKPLNLLKRQRHQAE